MFASLASIAGEAEKLKVRWVTRPTEDDRMDVIDLKVFGTRTDSASAALLDVQRLDVGNREGSARRFFARAANVLMHLVEHPHAICVSLLPVLDVAFDLVSKFFSGAARMLLDFGRVSFGVVFLVLRGILPMKSPSAFCSALFISQEPYGRPTLLSRSKFFVALIRLGKMLSRRNFFALDALAGFRSAFCVMAVNAGRRRHVCAQALFGRRCAKIVDDGFGEHSVAGFHAAGETHPGSNRSNGGMPSSAGLAGVVSLKAQFLSFFSSFHVQPASVRLAQGV